LLAIRREALAVFNANNTGRPVNEIDLHGLNVKEGLQIVKKKLLEGKAQGICILLLL
jgi:hypothetical protein